MDKQEITDRLFLLKAEGLDSVLGEIERNYEQICATCGTEEVALMNNFVKLVRSSLATNNTSSAVECSFLLGRVIQRLQVPTQIAIDYLAVLDKEALRTAPLKAKARGNQLLKYACEYEAKLLWDADRDQSLSVGDVAELIFNDFQTKKRRPESSLEIGYRFLAELTLPANVSTIRKYVKEVAPDYARKPGRRPN
jgi:hypothetical protein